ncbi:ubiquinone biosynthesis accessory factor UbiJ [Thalassolituus sp. UBA2009]|uniref:ubiquinone biosynthesis accessory factor UbiJ n=1 Tax=Thalassolituus sp. UBA2009 TaxID=1947658 RepID=UPI00257BE4F9|nr:SCP2 sterol-binding domain-containing protein [Thalassolituus sp. UBA2009]
MLSKLPAELLQAACVPFEAAINHVLRYDPAALNSLRRQQGRLLCVRIDAINPVLIRIVDNGIVLSLVPATGDNGSLNSADATLSGSAADFFALARASDKAHALISSAIDMDGDSEFALSLTRVAQNLDIDWEALITPLTGGLLAHQLGKGLRGLLNWGKSSAPAYRNAVKEYLEDEAQLLTPEPLAAQFADEVDQLRLTTDRLEARTQRLAARMQQNDSTNKSTVSPSLPKE